MDNFMDTLAERYNAQEMIRANSQADTMQMEGLQEQVEAYEAVLQEMRKLNYKNTELTEKMYSLVDESIEKVRTLQLEASENGANTEAISKEMSEAVSNAVNEALYEVQGRVTTLSGDFASVKDSSELIYTSLEDVLAETKALAQKVEEIRQQPVAAPETPNEVVVDNTEIISAVNESSMSVKETVQALSIATEGVNAGVSAVNDNISEMSSSVSAMKEKTDTIDTYVRGLWESVEATKTALQKLADNSAENSADVKPVSMDTDAITSAITSIEELKETLNSLKSAQDESKSSMKTSIDSAIYGLKQDNREIVEFMQRMNANIVAKNEDTDKEQKEQEELEKEQEMKKAFEERLKANEDFMHKESVKVYRNVQAVINEKTDQQTDSIDSRVKKNAQQISQLKVIAILATVISAADLAVLLLRIFGIL